MSNAWLSLDTEFESELRESAEKKVKDKLQSGIFSVRDLNKIQSLDLMPFRDATDLSEDQLELFRKLCQAWDLDLRLQSISSHRPLIGPVIVGLKKLIFPVLRALLKDILRQQREFNATSIALLADLYRRDNGLKRDQ